MKRLIIPFFALILVGVAIYGCSKGSDTSGGGSTDATEDFKKGMLTNYADNIITPAYTNLQDNLNVLESSINTFLSTPSNANQQTLKNAFKNAYLSFETVSVANFGPASALSLNNSFNTFPTVVEKIEAGIQTGTYNFTQPVLSDSIQGFPALDYLLFSTDAVKKFSEPGASANRIKYVQDVVTRMKSLTSNALSQWKGNYHTAFINSTKTDVGSSIGYLINQFAFEMDALKGPRIGWPYGKQSGGILFADKCEAYYSGITAELAVANLTSLKNYYTGANADGIADYLLLLKKDQLNTDVLTQFDKTLNALKAIPDPMSDAFTNNKPLIDEAYKQVQSLLTLLKTDVASATGVRINYQDSDGD